MPVVRCPDQDGVDVGLIQQIPVVRELLGFATCLFLTQFFVLLTWVPFRAESVGYTLTIWSAFAGLRDGGSEMLIGNLLHDGGILLVVLGDCPDRFPDDGPCGRR